MNFGLTKRQKIVVASVIVTFGLLSTQLVNFNLRFRFLAILTLISYLASMWALWEGLGGFKNFNEFRTKASVVLILPTLFTLGLASFYFLLPVRWLTRLPIAFVFGLSFYSLLLSQNVFNVAAMRTIPLYRAASTVAFLYTLITAFFLYNVIHAFNLLFIWNGILVVLISFPLILQILWSVEMGERVRVSLIFQSFVLSLVLGELGLVLSFWPLVSTMWSMTLASAMYVLLGIFLLEMRERLTKRVTQEYLLIGLAVLIIAFVTTSWSG